MATNKTSRDWITNLLLLDRLLTNEDIHIIRSELFPGLGPRLASCAKAT